MKFLLFSTVMLAGLGAAQLQAQSNDTTTTSTTTTTAPAAAPAPPPNNPMANALTTDERTQFIAARTKAMADNPSLQAEETDLMQKGMILRTGTPSDEDKQAFRADVIAHMAKVRTAILKADPTVKPILDKLEAAAAARMQQEGH